jgi:nucleoside-diphosphate-sugar epimerase
MTDHPAVAVLSIHFRVIPIFTKCPPLNEPLVIFGDGAQSRDFVNVREVVQANDKTALAQGVIGALNIASGKRSAVNEKARLMAKPVDLNPDWNIVLPERAVGGTVRRLSRPPVWRWLISRPWLGRRIRQVYAVGQRRTIMTVAGDGRESLCLP